MKKTILLIVISFIVSSIAFAGEQDTSSAVNDALDNFAQGGAAPRWRSSLSEIEKTAAALVSTNEKLLAEYKSLNEQLAGIDKDVAEQQRENEAQSAALEARRREILSPADVSDFKGRMSEADKEAEVLRSRVLAGQARLRTAGSKTSLRKLKVQELEIEKKSLLLDQQARSVAALNALRESVRLLKEKAASQKAQIEFVRQKTAELKGLDRPYLKESRQLAEDNAKARGQLAQLRKDQAGLQKQVDAAVDSKEKAVASPEARRAQALAARKLALESRIAVADKKKQELSVTVESQEDTRAEVEARIKDVEMDNKRIEDALGNARENIAVLEYRINTLTRYKNRNSEKN